MPSPAKVQSSSQVFTLQNIKLEEWKKKREKAKRKKKKKKKALPSPAGFQFLNFCFLHPLFFLRKRGFPTFQENNEGSVAFKSQAQVNKAATIFYVFIPIETWSTLFPLIPRVKVGFSADPWWCYSYYYYSEVSLAN